MNKYLLPSSNMKKQKGVVLIMALVILFAMTLIGVTSMNTTSLEERIASNYRDRQVAFQAAEAALRQGERDASTSTNSAYAEANYTDKCTSANGNGLCDCRSTSTSCITYWTDSLPAPISDVAWNVSTTHRSYTGALAGVTTPAKYIIEFMGYICPSTVACTPGAGDPKMFRVTALATGRTNSSKVMLQSTFQVNDY